MRKRKEHALKWISVIELVSIVRQFILYDIYWCINIMCIVQWCCWKLKHNSKSNKAHTSICIQFYIMKNGLILMKVRFQIYIFTLRLGDVFYTQCSISNFCGETLLKHFLTTKKVGLQGQQSSSSRQERQLCWQSWNQISNCKGRTSIAISPERPDRFCLNLNLACLLWSSITPQNLNSILDHVQEISRINSKRTHDTLHTNQFPRNILTFHTNTINLWSVSV